MSDDKAVKFDKGHSLDKLNDGVGRHEGRYGPLKALDHTASKSVAIYERDEAPAETVRIVLKVGGQAVVDTGDEKVCEGTVWILDQETEVVAVRRKS